MKRRLILVVCCVMRIGIWELCTAQPPELKLPQMVPVSPEAAAVGRYVDYPVDYCTGVVKTEIPLYEIKVGDLVLPITLSYHASGLKVKEPSGWVGNGWTLNCEPSIMRTVHGLPDEESYPNTGFLNVKRSMMNEVDHYYQIALGRRDGEPDAFYFKLADSGGKFYIDRRLPDSDNFQAQLYPAGKEKIYFDRTLNYFTLTDENGIMYQFDTKETMGRIAQIPTRWMGSSIHSPTTSSKISFEYLKQEIELAPMFNDKVTIQYNRDNHHIPELLTEYKNGQAKSYTIDALGRTTYSGTQSAPSSYYMDQNIQRCRISRVAFGNSGNDEETGHIVFTVSPSFRLQKISVYDALGQPVREALFYITPFNALTEHTKLDSLHILNATGNIVERYRFVYQYPSQVPSIYTLSVDHWGYFNAADNTGLVMVPLGQVDNLSIGGANRNASSAMEAGVLKRIFWPGGRMTEFGYEINSYMSEYTTQYVGGLRIKTIDDRDRATGRWFTRVFDYDGEYAVERMKPILDNYRYDYQVHTWTTQTVLVKPVRCYQSNAIANLMFSTGAPLIYGKVTETRQGNDLTGQLKTDYYYTGRYQAEQRSSFTPHYFNPETDWMYGVLQKKYEYRWENGAYAAVKSTVYELGYTGVLKTGPSYQAYFNKVLQPEDRFSLDEKRAAATYTMNLRTTEKILVKKETQTESFPGGGSVVTVKNYEYNNNNSVLSQKHLNPIKITSTTSTGTLVETFAYPEDIAYPSASSEEQGRLSLVNANMIHKPMEYKRTENGATTTTEWRYSGGKIRDIWSKIDGAWSFQPRMMIHEYNAYGNPACVSETSELKTMYIWGYNNQYPIAKIEGFRYYFEVTNFIGLENLQAMENRTVPSARDWETIRNMQNAYPNILITTYTYQPPAGIRSETDPSGRTVYYEYDAAGRLKWIQDESGNILKAHYYHLVHGGYY